MMQRRQICERSVFDGGTDDPRLLVHRYQQRMRAKLLAKAATEARREAWFVDFFGTLAATLGGLLRSITAPAARSTTAPARARLRLVPTTQVAF